jgi:nucleoside-diphosphate-sugar epimerase
VTELAHLLRELFRRHPDHVNDGEYSDIVETSAESYYGQGYQDILTRKPSIEKARNLLGWNPQTDLATSLSITLDAFLEEAREHQGEI